jgi:hypothetical protein
MNGNTRDDVVLRRYLLGSVAPDVRERIDERLFSNDEIFWEHLSLIEDELIESYVSNELEHEDAERFERSFLCTDERRSKLEFARALRAYVATRQPVPASLWQRLQETVSVPAWAVAAAVAVILALPAAGGFFRGSAERPDAGATDVSASLSTGLVRGATGELPRVELSSGCKLLRLSVEPDEEHPRYRATLHEVDGDEIWSQSLASADVDGRTAVTVTVPCELLPAGDYYVTLGDAARPDASSNPASVTATPSRANFRVLRP